MDRNFNNENEPWEYSIDIYDFDFSSTPMIRSSSSVRVEPSIHTPNAAKIIPGLAGSVCFEPSFSTPNPIRILPGLAGLVQRAKQLEDNMFILDSERALMSKQEYMQKVVIDFNSEVWINATNYVFSTGSTVTGCLGDIDNFLEKGKLARVVAIVESCSPNCLGDLSVTVKDLSGTVRGTIHHKLLEVSTYGKDIHVGVAIILTKISVFTPREGEHYLNITKKNVVKVFRKDTVLLD